MVSIRQTIILTTFALIAFAGNSVLARLALVDGAIGVGSYTTIRLLSGAVVLALIVGVRSSKTSGSWNGALALLGYAALFSLAYLELSTGMGALILFASVQITMIGWAFLRGERLDLIQSLGILAAVAGLVWLLLPGLARPDPLAAALMIGSGACWGVYSLMGRGGGAPTAVTAGNFVRASILALPLFGAWLILGSETSPSGEGVVLAVASGALTSGLGYAIWYRALKGLSAARAGIVQLLVPPLAALGGIILLSEPLTGRFIIASAMILAGIALAVSKQRRAGYANSK